MSLRMTHWQCICVYQLWPSTKRSISKHLHMSLRWSCLKQCLQGERIHRWGANFEARLHLNVNSRHHRYRSHIHCATPIVLNVNIKIVLRELLSIMTTHITNASSKLLVRIATLVLAIIAIAVLVIVIIATLILASIVVALVVLAYLDGGLHP